MLERRRTENLLGFRDSSWRRPNPQAVTSHSKEEGAWKKSTEFYKGPTRSAKVGRPHPEPRHSKSNCSTWAGAEAASLHGRQHRGSRSPCISARSPRGRVPAFHDGRLGIFSENTSPRASHSPCCTVIPASRGRPPAQATSSSRQLSRVKTLTPKRQEEAGSCGYSTKKAGLSHSPFRELNKHTHFPHLGLHSPESSLSR